MEELRPTPNELLLDSLPYMSTIAAHGTPTAAETAAAAATATAAALCSYFLVLQDGSMPFWYTEHSTSKASNNTSASASISARTYDSSLCVRFPRTESANSD